MMAMRDPVPGNRMPAAPGAPALPEHDLQLIRAEAAASDRAGMLSPALQRLIHERGWLRMLAPEAAGGAELALPQAVRLEEALAAADGSTGWSVTLCAGAAWFAGFLEPRFAREILATPNLCIGGSGAPSGFADIDGDGYRLSGRWEFATGAPMTTHFTLNAVLREHGQPLADAGGAARVRAFIVPASQVAIHENWRTIGLRATASHGFSLDRAWVDARHAFEIAPGAATAGGPLYRFPFMSLAYVTLAANVAGMAASFLAMAQAVIAQRKHHLIATPLPELPQVRDALREATGGFEAARTLFYRLLDAMWDAVCRGTAVDVAGTRALHAAALGLVDTGRRAVDALYPLCGLRAADEASDIGRVWRDLHTATQHALLLPLAD
jgi:alkylation response protein AidB-like acyl-CoA dehydrogenase